MVTPKPRGVAVTLRCVPPVALPSLTTDPSVSGRGTQTFLGLVQYNRHLIRNCRVLETWLDTGETPGGSTVQTRSLPCNKAGTRAEAPVVTMGTLG